MAQVLEFIRKIARQAPKRIIFPESEDPRVMHAALEFNKGNYGTALFIRQGRVKLHDIEVFEHRTDRDDWYVRCIDVYSQLQATKGIKVEQAALELNSNPLLLAAVLVNIGYADGGVAGSVATTADVVRAGLRGIGLADGKNLLSSMFLMELKDRVMTYADCGVVPNPDAEQLACIAIDSAENHLVLTGEEARVALLSFSTKGSTEHAHVVKVRKALDIARQRRPALHIDGELQFDAAFDPEVAKLKLEESAVAGKANVFIFPDLSSGNIAYKITERIGGATALGPLLQGLAKPWMDLSRGCTAKDILDIAVITAFLA